MKKTPLLLIFATTAIVATAGAETGSSPYTLAVGWNYLSTKDNRDYSKDSGYSVAVGYRLSNLLKVLPSLEPAVELSYAENAGNGRRIDLAKLELVLRTPLGSGTSSFAPYAGLGFGVGRAEAKTADRLIAYYRPDPSDKKVVLAGKLLVGAKLTRSFYTEAAYNFSGMVANRRTDAYSLSVGYRF